MRISIIILAIIMLAMPVFVFGQHISREEITIGTGNSTENYIPLNFYWKNSLSQTLYFPDEFGNAVGYITGISYENNFSSNLTDMSVNIWIGETTQTNLSGGWISSNDITQVFSGTNNFPSGQNTIYFEFDEPFFYEGGNLVLLIQRPMDTQYYSSNDKFYVTDTSAHADRTRYFYSDSTTGNPASPPPGTLSNKFPNTTFHMILGGVGHVEGHVFDNEGAALQGADIVIEGTDYQAESDNSGFYQIENVVVDDYTITASLFGYSPQSNQIEIIENETTTSDFNLIPLDEVSVSGQVVGSDFPEIGLEGAHVTITGFEDYETYTDADGYFEFPGVYTNITYELQISIENYDTYLDDLVVEEDNLDLGVIVLTEIAVAPGNVQVSQNETGTEAYLSWAPPGTGNYEFRYDDGNQTTQIGFSQSYPNHVFGAVHHNNALIEEVHWFLTSTYGSHNNVRIYLFGLTSNGNPDQTALLYQSPFVNNTDNQWNSHELSEPVNAPNGFLVGVSTPNQYTGIGLDDGIGEPWQFVSGTQMSITDWTDEELNWIDIGSWGFQRNMLIRAYGVNYGDLRHDRASENRLYANPESISKANIRAFEHYNIYRFLTSQQSNPDQWDLVATEVVDTTYTDTSWAGIPNGVYRYAVTSAHTNDVESEPAFSQPIEQTMTSADEEIVPSGVSYLQNYPNPFNPETTISYGLGEASEVHLTIYNIMGKKVRSLVNEYQGAGQHSVVWDGLDSNHNKVASGIYLYRIKTEKSEVTKKMLLMK